MSVASIAEAPMSPADALRHIVYLLDRNLAEGRRVRAFTNALDVVTELGEDELRSRHADGSLTDLPGIGASTGRVIAQALDGQVPDYLAKLQTEPELPAGHGGELRAAIRGDCHMHSTWSDGGAPVEDMARTCIALGHEYMVLTDHSPRLTVAHGLSAERLTEQLELVARLNTELAPFRILSGIEVDILVDGSLDQNQDLLAELDVVVASVHSKLSMPADEMTKRMVMAIASPHTDILGHLTNRKVPGAERPIGQSDFTGRPPSRFDPEMVFAACARFDVAVEINSRPERMDPPDDLLALALEWDCRVSIDTDAHAPGQLEWLAFGCDKAARHGIEPDRIVNTWSADELLAWTASHAATG